jgi:hypothetical protein|tara:strand:+ start:21996 stop:22232 length:237 start_codon:yes stop_codon:yes gene_type:complete
MDDLLIRVLTRLLRVHEELGERAFEEASHRALVSIALAVQIEADRRAGVSNGAPRASDVVSLPLASSRRHRALRPDLD